MGRVPLCRRALGYNLTKCVYFPLFKALSHSLPSFSAFRSGRFFFFCLSSVCPTRLVPCTGTPATLAFGCAIEGVIERRSPPSVRTAVRCTGPVCVYAGPCPVSVHSTEFSVSCCRLRIRVNSPPTHQTLSFPHRGSFKLKQCYSSPLPYPFATVPLRFVQIGFCCELSGGSRTQAPNRESMTPSGASNWCSLLNDLLLGKHPLSGPLLVSCQLLIENA